MAKSGRVKTMKLIHRSGSVRCGNYISSYWGCAGRIYLSLPPPLPRNTSLERRRKREIRIYRAVTFPNINDFSAEYIKDLVITQRKTHSVVSLLLKERFPDKKGFSSRSVWRFFFKNGINLHNHLLNAELGQCTWDVQL